MLFCTTGQINLKDQNIILSETICDNSFFSLEQQRNFNFCSTCDAIVSCFQFLFWFQQFRNQLSVI